MEYGLTTNLNIEGDMFSSKVCDDFCPKKHYSIAYCLVKQGIRSTIFLNTFYKCTQIHTHTHTLLKLLNLYQNYFVTGFCNTLIFLMTHSVSVSTSLLLSVNARVCFPAGSALFCDVCENLRAVLRLEPTKDHSAGRTALLHKVRANNYASLLHLDFIKPVFSDASVQSIRIKHL